MPLMDCCIDPKKGYEILLQCEMCHGVYRGGFYNEQTKKTYCRLHYYSDLWPRFGYEEWKAK